MSVMSSQLSIQAGLSIGGSGGNIAPSRSVASALTPVVKPVPLFVNPSFQFDPTVGLVVIKFHNDTGELTNSIPSQRQLAAYRSHQATPPGEQVPQSANTPRIAPGKTSAG
jgi:hypothetical protein